MYGWHGQALHVNLSNHKIHTAAIDRELLHSYLGGRGLGVRLMRDAFRLDPFDPEMPLIFCVGPLCGSDVPTTARLSVVSRSPLTGTVYESSAGGRFADRLKKAGYDALVISGQSAHPVTLSITSKTATIHPANKLWGATVSETVRRLAQHGSVAAIGPAGENRVLFASIMMGEGDAVGRGGLGAVMGSKNLKAITADGERKTVIADADRVKRAEQDIMRLFRASPVLLGELGISRYGTPALVDLMTQRRMVPTENFRKTFFAEAASYSGPAIRREFGATDNGCYACPIHCKKSTPEGEQLPEYETVSHFGALIHNWDLHSIILANTLCNELGLDPISAAATLSAWGEIKGKFPKPDEIEALLHDIATKKGEGALLALGSRRMAEQLGHPEKSMTVKSLELPAYDPRGAYGLALAYCTSNCGGSHLQAYPISHEILRKPIATDRFSFAGKGRIIKIAEDSNAVIDSLAACKFACLGATLEEYAEAFVAVTGCDYSPGQLNQIGERIFLTERYYNMQNGFDRDDDMLPERFFNEAGSSGDGIDIRPLDRARFLEERRKYYRIRGLDEDGNFNDPDFLARQP